MQNHNPAAQNGFDSAWNILSPIWKNQQITVLRTKYNGTQGWLNYRSGFGEVVDRYRWEAGCIAEHVSFFTFRVRRQYANHAGGSGIKGRSSLLRWRWRDGEMEILRACSCMRGCGVRGERGVMYLSSFLVTGDVYVDVTNLAQTMGLLPLIGCNFWSRLNLFVAYRNLIT